MTGVEHLSFGYRDFTRLPGKDDGVFFTRPFVEGKPGIQPERLPPYVAALNPGWDPSLPRYKPLAMFDAQKAALAKDGPQPSPWSQRTQTPPRPAAPAPTIEKVGFIGDRNGPLARRLVAHGVPLAEGTQAFNIADGVAPTEGIPGTTLVMLRGANASALQPFNCSLTDRSATALVPDAAHPWTAPFELPDLYFAEDGPDRFIMRHGIAGPAVERGRVLLRASDTDWSLFNNAPEHAKCAAVVLHEHLVKPSGAALVETVHGKGKLLLCSLDWRVASRPANTFWRRLLTNAGIKLGEPTEANVAAFDEQGALFNSLAIGRFPSASVEAALKIDFIGEARNRGTEPTGKFRWQAVNSPSRDRFVFSQLAVGQSASVEARSREGDGVVGRLALFALSTASRI